MNALRLLSVALLLAPAAMSLGAPGNVAALAFEVVRSGKPMGRHTITVTRSDDEVIADIAIDLEVKFAFVTLYRYEHRNRERWRGGRLVSIETRTDNDGKRLTVSGRATDEGFVVTDSDGRERVHDPDILPTSYWDPRTRDATRLLNTQTGAIANVTIAPASTDAADAPGTHYVVSGDLDLNLWYDDGCLTKLSFRAPKDNSLIDYRPQSPAAAAETCPARVAEWTSAGYTAEVRTR